MGRARSNRNIIGKAIPETQEDRERSGDATADKVTDEEVFQETIDPTTDLRNQLNGNAQDARIGLEKKRMERGDHASGQQTTPVVDPQLQAVVSTIVATLAQNHTVLNALMPRIGENTTPPPPPPQPLVMKVGNDKGVEAQDTSSSHSHPASLLRARPTLARGKVSTFNRLGDTYRRQVSERMTGWIGGREPSSPRESLGSVSRTADRSRLDKGKGKLHKGDANITYIKLIIFNYLSYDTNITYIKFFLKLRIVGVFGPKFFLK
ncbi:unnamed protein product [Cuscuta europaea]|uniref:Uncharacterized protein n=1 Tax=Cuscuta europaea TaxID=41803 RepID=A0A9P0ZW01_CUSEU|nr:unnamed protein product [Cuscuta europaea]